jgi:hypothetical protein
LKYNVILEWGTTHSTFRIFEPVGQVQHQTQPNLQFMSQSEQMGYGLVSENVQQPRSFSLALQENYTVGRATTAYGQGSQTKNWQNGVLTIHFGKTAGIHLGSRKPTLGRGEGSFSDMGGGE